MNFNENLFLASKMVGGPGGNKRSRISPKTMKLNWKELAVWLQSERMDNVTKALTVLLDLSSSPQNDKQLQTGRNSDLKQLVLSLPLQFFIWARNSNFSEDFKVLLPLLSKNTAVTNLEGVADDLGSFHTQTAMHAFVIATNWCNLFAQVSPGEVCTGKCLSLKK